MEHLFGDNKYKCEKCRCHVNATKQFTLAKLPLILILHLKRFDYMSLFASKLDKHISFDLALDLSPFVSENVEKNVF